MRKPSVLHVYKDYYPPVLGGVEKCIHAMCAETRSECNARVLVASHKGPFIDEDIDGVRVVRVACHGRFLSTPLAPGFLSWLRRLDSDILHFHMPNPTGELAYLLAPPKRGRLVATYHSDIVRQRLTGMVYRPLQQRFLAHARLIMPTSRHYMETSAALLAHRDRCRPLPLGVALDAMRETDQTRAYSNEIKERAKGRVAIIFIGLFRYYKGLPYLLRAMSRLAPAQSCLFLAGGAARGHESEQRDLEKLVAELNLGERVYFLGEIDDAQAVGLRRAGDIFCLPSHLRSEAFGLTQIEAMACGLPVVGTRLPGVSEVNREGETGLTVEPSDIDALARALERLIENPDLRRRLGHGAAQRATTQYSSKIMGERLLEAYRDVLAPAADEKN